jgi:hypothetical protein
MIFLDTLVRPIVLIIQRKFGGFAFASFYDTIEFRICDMV